MEVPPLFIPKAVDDVVVRTAPSSSSNESSSLFQPGRLRLRRAADSWTNHPYAGHHMWGMMVLFNTFLLYHLLMHRRTSKGSDEDDTTKANNASVAPTS